MSDVLKTSDVIRILKSEHDSYKKELAAQDASSQKAWEDHDNISRGAHQINALRAASKMAALKQLADKLGIGNQINWV